MVVFLGQALGQVVANPIAAARFVNLFVVSNVLILILAFLYALFAIRVWVQVRRLETWLPLLRGYGFSTWALIHVILAVLSIVLVIGVAVI